jgi:hypothetical protein
MLCRSSVMPQGLAAEGQRSTAVPVQALAKTNSGVGASLAGIVSQRWDWGTIHLNAETAVTRNHRADFFLGGIIEGPSKWSIRPVAELFYERELDQSEMISGLAGLIRTVHENLSFDVGCAMR